MPADQSSHSQGSWSAWSECRRHWRAYVLAWAVAIAAAVSIPGACSGRRVRVRRGDGDARRRLLAGRYGQGQAQEKPGQAEKYAVAGHESI